jgi:hypothetical protein
MLLVTALLGAVALGHALPLEVANMRFDRAIVFAFALVGHPDVGAASLAGIAVGPSVDTAHRCVDLGATTPFTHAFVLRASEDALLADPADRAIVIATAEGVLRDALTGLANVARSAIDERAQVHAHAWQGRLGRARVHAVV